MAEVKVVTNDGSSSDHSALVNCPAGYYAIGGGGEAGGSSHLKHSGPALNPHGKPVGWKVKANNGTPTAFAVCAPIA
jgi:hypothetical protein